MKFAVVVLACMVVASQAQFRGSNPFNRNSPFKSQPYRPAPVAPVPSRVSYSGDARNAQILKADSDIGPDGSYNYYYETDNGIAAQAQGTPRNFGGNPPLVPVVAQGSFSWTSPEGVPVAITYVADENGYQPQGAAIPTSPPVPPQILRALEYIARSAPRK
ncbi:larval cuticle protein LCP-22-like [Hyposmocoma kahamanoa]|uniref:larval cuticle protein LCP-22-like n=1 Tax=Hyposmocoma kahamanoa TaxID=1477025 RepID=UPI000E6D920C|nr:larval cuticle protein LCP-22-like [Hyposmocoma kahamanoa]